MELYCEHSGRGPRLVLVHGWGLHGGVWGSLPAALSRRFRVSVVDLPGHGRSRGWEEPYTLSALARAVARAVDGPAVWLGWSFGGLVALAAALEQAERVQRLILVSTSPRFVRGPDWPWAMPAPVLAQFARDLGGDYRRTLLRFLALQVGQGPAERRLLKHLRAEMFRHGEPEPRALVACLDLLQESDLRAALPRIPQPALVIHGGRDRLAHPEAGNFLAARLVQGQGHQIEDAAHAPFLSHTALFLQRIEAFLNNRTETHVTTAG